MSIYGGHPISMLNDQGFSKSVVKVHAEHNAVRGCNNGRIHPRGYVNPLVKLLFLGERRDAVSEPGTQPPFRSGRRLRGQSRYQAVVCSWTPAPRLATIDPSGLAHRARSTERCSPPRKHNRARRAGLRPARQIGGVTLKNDANCFDRRSALLVYDYAKP